MDWFRMYSEVVHDPKVQKLSPTLFKHWVNVMCLANDNEPRGCVPPPRDVAFGLRISEGRATVMLDELLALTLLDADDEGNLWPHNWDARQFESDNSTSRVKRYRQKRNVTGNVSTALHETPPEQNRTEQKQNRPRTDPEADRDGIVVPVVRAFERCFGRPLSPMEIEGIKALDEEHPRDRIDYALRETASLGKRSVRYVQRICEMQATNGDNRDATKPVGRNEGQTAASGDPVADAAAIYASMGIRDISVFLGPDGAGADGGLASLDVGDDTPRLEVRR